MIQELFGGRSSVTLINGDRSKLSINNTTPNTPTNSTCNISSSSSSSSSAISSNNSANPTSENLRCPRCDSSNTKFCYYNNYNLTQPRHFCKTCRRYWTKGGALRNVPIGGGCRKNKSPNVSVQKSTSAAGKLIKAISPEIGMLRSSSPLSSSQGLFMSGFDQHVDQYNQTLQNPIFWAANSQSSHFLSLLRANQNQNPNPNPNHHVLASSVKENDGVVFSAQSQFGSEPNLVSGMNLPLQTSSIGLSSTNYYSNRSHGHQSQGIILGEVQNRDGLQELYQKLRSSPADNYNNAPVILGNTSSSSSSFSSAVTTVLESAPVASSGELGFWNSSLSWTADLTAANGAYP